MDATEKMAEDFLTNLGCPAIVYEPDGNVPPDFLVNSTIAVEVRRLNQLVVDETGKVVGLERADIPLWQRITNLVNNFSVACPPPTTFGVFYRFGRPIPAWKKLQSELSAALTAFINGSKSTPHKASLPCGLSIRIFDWKKDKGSAFRIAGSSDQQSGGFIVENLQFALQHAVAEKEAKTSKYRSNYQEWWLVLVHYMVFWPDEHDRRQLFEGWGVQHTFDKVFVVNPLDLGDYFEL